MYVFRRQFRDIRRATFRIGPIHAFIPLSTFRTFAAGSDQSPLGINPLTLKRTARVLLMWVVYYSWNIAGANEKGIIWWWRYLHVSL